MHIYTLSCFIMPRILSKISPHSAKTQPVPGACIFGCIAVPYGGNGRFFSNRSTLYAVWIDKTPHLISYHLNYYIYILFPSIYIKSHSSEKRCPRRKSADLLDSFQNMFRAEFARFRHRFHEKTTLAVCKRRFAFFTF